MSLRYTREARGYQIETGPEGFVKENDTFTCSHCQRITVLRPMCDPTEAGGLCKCCMGLICGPCVDRGGCDPIEKKLARAEASYNARRSYGI